ncbi:methyltransferase domain-containing protein [Nocardioides sp. GY 10113]|uniref:class I SAM-dependent methyltransferase n=1 Tax=Nocardioides sp. GY 10113 TaxID=2569761 RepID=UPI0010A7FBAF|nr:class I SAM-dependent methyltransferase [Nocardioides sp. GY 10113]TIC88547.1 methyltransferase domain-containing protein [Nocardioides sp. GY 10113]
MAEDAWLAGDRYEPYIGRWSRLVAPRFLSWLGAPSDLRWVDVGCGTGALTAAIAEWVRPRSVLGVDPSPGFVAWAEEHHASPEVGFRVAGVEELAEESADVVVSGLVLNFLPDPAAALAAMARAACPGGEVAAYVWDYAGGMQLLSTFWEAAVALDPAAAAQDEAARFAGWDLARLEGLWRDAGLERVGTTAVAVDALYPSATAAWVPFLGATGPAPGYVAGLAEEHRQALRDRFLTALPTAEDGAVRLSARALGVRGRRGPRP